MPSRWGNDQLRIAFAASVCDFRYPVVWNNGGVACVYTNVRREQDEAPKPSASASPSPSAEPK